MENRYSVDRINGNIVVLVNDDGFSSETDLNLLPHSIKSGDVVIFDGNSYKFSETDTEEMRQQNIELLNRLKNKRKKNV